MPSRPPADEGEPLMLPVEALGRHARDRNLVDAFLLYWSCADWAVTAVLAVLGFYTDKAILSPV